MTDSELPVTSRIRRLPPALISQIAAGEVVERPSSIVKELLENALDAGARRIDVEVEEGGRRKILVRDDGSGMTEDDALLAFEPHATSKIDRFEDLEKIGSYGFRGEALASISAVARTELITATEDGAGFKVVVSGGEVLSAEPTGAPKGTTLIVSDLFSHVPARRQFLKIPSAEMRRCLEVVQGYALAMPTVAFSFRNEKKRSLETVLCDDDTEGRLERIAQVFGVTLASQLIALPHRPSVSGFVGRPETTRGRRIFIFVNRRMIKDRAVLAAFYRTVRDEWKTDRFPALFLFLDVPPEEVDVNVHPQKAEVRFRDQRIIGRVVNSLKSGLAEGRVEGDAPLKPVGAIPQSGLAWQGQGQLHEQNSSVREDGALVEYRREGVIAEGAAPYDSSSSGGSLLEHQGARLTSSDRIQGFSPTLKDAVELETGTPVRSSPLSRGSEGRPLRLLAQYKGSLLLLEGEDGLYLIDQHAAHERILYERFRSASLTGKVQSQRLLMPREIEGSGAEASVLIEASAALEVLGFEVAGFSGDAAYLTAVPAFFSESEAEQVLLDLAGRVKQSEDTEDEVAFMRKEVLEAMAASSACKSAIKIHHRLNEQQMQQLVTELFEAEQPYTCPHGRPTLLKMGDSELERRFGRR